jgi:hypothetical protein
VKQHFDMSVTECTFQFSMTKFSNNNQQLGKTTVLLSCISGSNLQTSHSTSVAISAAVLSLLQLNLYSCAVCTLHCLQLQPLLTSSWTDDCFDKTCAKDKECLTTYQTGVSEFWYTEHALPKRQWRRHIVTL